MTKFLFVTGGVVSSLGKGITAASIGAVLKARGDLTVSIMKLDPYLNVDPGTMNPCEHGEVFVTDDGAETDLDLGHYERFLNQTMSKLNNITSGQVYNHVISQERKGEYLGKTIQVIPHITDDIKRRIRLAGAGFDILIVEIGGTVGDIESQPFTEAARQMKLEDQNNVFFAHLTYVPYLKSSKECKTKPTQHSVKDMRSQGIQPDLLICRSDDYLSTKELDKICMFTNVPRLNILSLPDVNCLFKVPNLIDPTSLENVLQLDPIEPNLETWERLVEMDQHRENIVRIAIVGKYITLPDAYKSLIEALQHAGMHTNTTVNIDLVDAEKIHNDTFVSWGHSIKESGPSWVSNYDGIIIPGGFGDRGIEGKIEALRVARANNIPTLGICLGMQLMCVEFARNACGIESANSAEFDNDANLFHIIDDEATDMGGTMRLGAEWVDLKYTSVICQAYKGKENISERHRHRYEFNMDEYGSIFTEQGMKITGYSQQGFVECVESINHEWYIGVQFHPEYNSTPLESHPLFDSFIRAAYDFET